MNPSLLHKSQFKVMRRKVNEAAVKLSTVEMNHHQAAMCCNASMLTSVCFGSRIIQINEEYEVELMTITEPAILRKLGLSAKFP